MAEFGRGEGRHGFVQGKSILVREKPSKSLAGVGGV